MFAAAAAHVACAALMTTDADFDPPAGLYLSLIRIDATTGHTI